MQCADIVKSLDAWKDGECSADDAAGISRHLKQCPTCRREAGALKHIDASLKALPEIAVPKGFSRKALRLFRENVSHQGMAEWWRGLSLAMRSAVCGAAVAGLLFGAALGASLSPTVSQNSANPYQTLYASKGIYP